METKYRLYVQDNTAAVLRTVVRSLLFLMAAGLLVLDTGLTPSWLRYSCGLVILGLAAFQPWLEGRWKFSWPWVAIAALVLLAVGTFSPWLSLLFFLFGVGAIRFIKAPEIEVGEEGVRILRSWGPKEIAWSEIANVVLRDGLLTIDLHNNTLYQLELRAGDTCIPSEDVFNPFCATQLARCSSEAR